VAVVGPGALQEVADRDLLVIGTLARQPALGALLRGGTAPVRADASRIALALPDRMAGFRHMLARGAEDGPAEEALNRAAARLAAPPDGFGALLAFESPLRAGRSVVAVTAAVPGGLDAVLRALRDPERLPQVQGDIVLVSGDSRVEAFRSGAAYWHGSLPFWLWPEFYLGRRPEVMFGILVLACLLIALPIRRALRARAARRLRARSAGEH
jgi:cellulose synthase (UDP-forming)